jgi:hypothetical protein
VCALLLVFPIPSLQRWDHHGPGWWVWATIVFLGRPAVPGSVMTGLTTARFAERSRHGRPAGWFRPNPAKAGFDSAHGYSLAPGARRKRAIDLQIIRGDYNQER